MNRVLFPAFQGTMNDKLSYQGQQLLAGESMFRLLINIGSTQVQPPDQIPVYSIVEESVLPQVLPSDQLPVYSMVEESGLTLKPGISQTLSIREYIEQFGSKLWLDDAGNLCISLPIKRGWTRYLKVTSKAVVAAVCNYLLSCWGCHVPFARLHCQENLVHFRNSMFPGNSHSFLA